MTGWKLAMLLVLAVAIGGGLGSYVTNKYYDDQNAAEWQRDEDSLICDARISKGKSGDIKSDYFIYERAPKDHEADCKKFIEYKNLPANTETFFFGF